MLLFLLFLLLLNTPARAQGVADVGRELARRWCTACHVADREGTGADAGPPLPSLLAGKRSAEEIEGWLADPHPPMPNLELSRLEINDIMALSAELDGPVIPGVTRQGHR
jgi:mono/diheme cytochrome c family protein